MGIPTLAPTGESDSTTIAESLDRPESFAAIFDRHHLAVHRYVARRTSGAQADDLASLTFIVAFERRRSFQATSTTALPWLLGIATNLLHDRRRRERREHGALRLLAAEREPARSVSIAGGAREDPRTEALAGALAALDPGQLDVLLLYAWEELSYEQIAEALEIPLGTVRSRLARARAHLRSRLEELPAQVPIQEQR